jgi:hypothetical protein
VAPVLEIARVVASDDEFQGRVAGIDADAVFHAAILGEDAFEFGDRPTQHEIAALHDGQHGRVYFCFN